MKIIKADVLLNGSRHPVLVQEEACEYGGADTFSGPDDAARVMNHVFHMKELAEEYVYLIAADVKNRPLGFFLLSRGTIDASLFGIREIMVRLLLCGASGFIIAHNHPSGDAAPSAADAEATKKIAEAAEIMGIRFLDHIIIGASSFHSMADAIRKK